MNSLDSFSATYPEARTKFIAAALRAGGTLETISHPERGPDGGSLSTDVAWFGPRDAECVLVTVSATHGVEGFAGSGAQVDWLERGEAGRLPPGVAALVIHAINPYGFAWLRRVTHENVDLNRNWVDFGQPLPENRGYDELVEAICPEEWSEEGRRQAERDPGRVCRAVTVRRRGSTRSRAGNTGTSFGHFLRGPGADLVTSDANPDLLRVFGARRQGRHYRFSHGARAVGVGGAHRVGAAAK